MAKYTPATALAIKRDVQRSQKTLDFINQEIEIKRVDLEQAKKECEQWDNKIQQKRGLFANLHTMLFDSFNTRLKSVSDLKRYQSSLDKQIQQLEYARDLANAELQMKKQQVELPEIANLMDSIIQNLSEKLDGLLNQIDISEQELESLKTQKEEFKVVNKKLSNEREQQEYKVRIAMAKMEEIEKERTANLRQLAIEKSKLTEIQNREHDSAVMEGRLTKEYQKIYKSVPRRSKK